MTEQKLKQAANNLDTDQIVLNYVFVVVMMVCFAMVLVKAIESVPPGWNGNYLIILTLLISVESLITFRTIKQGTILDANPILLRFTEWVVILIVVKGLLYLLTDPAQLLVDFPLWRQDFKSFFLLGPYLPICFFLFIMWVLTGAFANSLDQLGEDIELLESEREGVARTNRGDTRRGLMSLIFALGSIMLFLTTVTQITNPVIKFLPNPLFADVVFILLFFVSGFVLLARSQLAILRARWYIENIPVISRVSTHWMLYTAILLISIAIIVIFLPTSYSLGILDLMRMLVQVIINILFFLQLVIFSPLIALLALLSRLLGGKQPPSSEAPPSIIPTPAPSSPIASPAWADIARSILFWGIFLFMVIYSVRHYLINRQGVLNGIQKITAFLNFRKAWLWFKNVLQGVNKRLSMVVEQSVDRVRQLFFPKPIHLDPFSAISSLLPARQRVQLIYLAMIRWNTHNGIPRKSNQTPNEYAQVLSSFLPNTTDDIRSVTNTFIEARYTRHTITHTQAVKAQESIENIQESIRMQQEQTQLAENKSQE